MHCKNIQNALQTLKTHLFYVDQANKFNQTAFPLLNISHKAPS